MHDLTSVDLGEYLLGKIITKTNINFKKKIFWKTKGKMAGTADKTAQLLARSGQVSMVLLFIYLFYLIIFRHFYLYL